MKITFKNRLASLIRQRKLSSASEFARQMTAAGYPMSSSHASRYEKENPPAFDINFVTVACNLLRCLPSDLYEIMVELEPGEDIDPMIVLPHAAMVVRKKTSSEQTPESHVSTSQPISNPNADATPLKPKVTTKTQKPVTGSDVGPSGVLFPFVKPD